MVRESLYRKTVDILVSAYFDDKLAHEYCSACAVGNLVIAGMNITTTRMNFCKGLNWHNSIPMWDEVFLTSNGYQNQQPAAFYGAAKKQIESTGYSWQDLAKIEYAFETSDKGNSDEDYMFNGLMAVIEVLDIIHENTDTSITEISKKRFDKASCQLQTV